MSDPDMGTWEYQYDANGNLEWQKDANQQEIEYVYDCLDRVTHKNYLNPRPGIDRNVVYSYDDENLTINHIGRLSRVTNGIVTTTIEAYDAMGRVATSIKLISGDQSRSTVNEYDPAGRIVHTIYPDGYELSYRYHTGSGLLDKVIGLGADGVEKQLAYYHDYAVTGAIGTVEFHNGVKTTYTTDPYSARLKQIVASDGTGSPFMDKSYTYTPAGDVETIDDAVNVNTRFFEYDKLHRLTDEYSSSDDYAYLNLAIMDYNYNPTEKPLNAVSGITTFAGTEVVFEYDDNGNLVSGPDMTDPESPATRTIIYNSDNMPVQISHSEYGVTDFEYDSAGGRARKSGPSGTTYYVGGHFHVGGTGSITKYIFAGGQRIAQIKDGQLYFYHQDHLGSSTALSDEAGNIVQRADYLPFGGQRGVDAMTLTNFGFTGQEKDPETGLYNYNSRLYDPAIALFVTADSVVPDPSSSIGYQRYGYCFNNPLAFTDGSGHEPVTAFAAVVVASAAFGAMHTWANGGDGTAILGGAMTGAAIGAMSAGAFSLAGEICMSFSQTGAMAPVYQGIVHMATGAVVGGLSSAMTGGDLGEGALYGAASAGFSKLSGHYLGIDKMAQTSPESAYALRMAVGGIADVTIASLTGGDQFQALFYGMAMAAVAYQFNDLDGFFKPFKYAFTYDTGMTPTQFEYKANMAILRAIEDSAEWYCLTGSVRLSQCLDIASLAATVSCNLPAGIAINVLEAYNGYMSYEMCLQSSVPSPSHVSTAVGVAVGSFPTGAFPYMTEFSVAVDLVDFMLVTSGN